MRKKEREKIRFLVHISFLDFVGLHQLYDSICAAGWPYGSTSLPVLFVDDTVVDDNVNRVDEVAFVRFNVVIKRRCLLLFFAVFEVVAFTSSVFLSLRLPRR